MKRFFIYAGLAMSLASCSTLTSTEQGSTQITQTSYEYEIQQSSARLLEPESTMLLTPLIADLEVSKSRVKYVEKDAFATTKITPALYNQLDNLKALALANAAQHYDADVMVGCTINVATVDKRLVITVHGYPAKYKNFRNATTKDTELIKAAQIFGNDTSLAPVNTSNAVVETVVRK